jgi:eukaryotic-like serine/threonine-protein kinase
MARTADLRASLPGHVELPERYQVVRRIANGGMASVWCAEDQVLGRRVAVKILCEPDAHDDAAVRRFQREARAAARLSGHPHVVTIYDVGTGTRSADGSWGTAFIVMEHLPGGTVADALRVGEVKREEAVRWIHEAAAALDYAHGRGVIHRDIKPANLLLDCDRVLHVADFGITRISSAIDDTITRTGQVFGTAAYLAPERALGHAATAASDRYSLAVAAFELLVGERPFKSESFAAQGRQHVEDEPPRASLRNRDLPRSVDAVLARGMAKRPEDRWESASAFAEAIEAALLPRPAEATAPLPSGRAARSAAAAAPLLSARAARFGPRGTEVAARRAPVEAGSRRGAHPNARPRVLALGALAAGALCLVALAAGSGSTGHPRSAARTQRVASRPVASPKRSSPRAAPPARATPPAHPSATSPTDVAATPAAATTPAPTAVTLEAQGHTLMLDGSYPQAVDVLRKAIAAASPGSPTYAYAMFDLGRSLRLAGNPTAAVGVLYQRLQIPNQTDVVRNELRLALEAMGVQANRAGGGAAAQGKGDAGARKHRKHGAGD